jgi:hypothetical protein
VLARAAVWLGAVGCSLRRLLFACWEDEWS